MSNKGITFERELKQLLEANGFSVIRGAGSKGQVFNEKADLVATKETGQNTKTAHMIIIQCKVKQKKKKNDKTIIIPQI